MPASLDAKNAMIAVAERMFAEQGIHEVSMRDVATAAGSPSSVTSSCALLPVVTYDDDR